MTESRAKIEFQTKKELYEAIAIACYFCKVVPRKGPIYQSNELIPKNEESNDESERPAKRPRLMVQKIACEDCFKPTRGTNFQRSVNLENTLYAFSVTSCKFRKSGCKVIQDLKNIEYHEEDCEFRDILCPFGYCKETISLSELKRHLKNHNIDLNNADSYTVVNDKVFKLNAITADHNVDDDINEQRQFHHFFRQNGKIFFIQLDINWQNEEKELFMIWIQLCGSKYEAKNYDCFIQIGDSHGRSMFKGPVRSLDDDKDEAFDKQYGLVVSWDFAKKFIDDEDSLTVEIEIEDLKPQEEQTDYDEPMEAATDAATADDDKEKDSKNR